MDGDGRLRIFIAGPYSAETREGVEMNVQKAMDVAACLWYRGHYPFVPHLFDLLDQHLQSKRRFFFGPMDYEDWMDWCASYLEVCDAVLYLGSSPGADRELLSAASRRIPIYTRLEQIPHIPRPKRETT